MKNESDRPSLGILYLLFILSALELNLRNTSYWNSAGMVSFSLFTPSMSAGVGDFVGGVVEQVGGLHFFTNGLRTFNCGKAEKSRSADHSSLTP